MRYSTNSTVRSKISSLNSRSFSSFLPPFEGSSLSTAAHFFSLNSAAFRCLFFFAAFRCFSLPVFFAGFHFLSLPVFLSLNSAAFRCLFFRYLPLLTFSAAFRCPLFSLPFTAAHFYYFSLLTLSAASLVGLKCHNLSLLQLYKGMFLMPFSSAITNWITLMFRLFSLRH